MTYLIIIALIIIIITLMYLLGDEGKKVIRLRKKYNDKMDEVTKQYFKYDEEIEELEKYKTRSIYRQKRIKSLEKKLAAATGDKSILKGRKLIK